MDAQSLKTLPARSVIDFGGWLRSLGLEQYEAAFRDNGIDASVLPSLTVEDLRDLGVLVGHRRKLLDAIAALRGEPGAEAAAAAERRQVTVMFADFVGTAQLSAAMDPEDLREVMSAYQQCAGATVHRFDGFVAKFLGDGVLAYFGYPQAHEDDAERAVRAGLELVEAVAALKARAVLQTRVGIATGVVVVGDLLEGSEGEQRGIIGETPNLAARLQGIAAPNMVVIAESTRRLVGNLFELQELTPRELKGIAEPVPAWVALRAGELESRFEALHPESLSALVGREEECELLLRRWAKAKTGDGQAVLLSGEAGIGKSRLTAALLERLGAGPYTRMRYFCSPRHTDSTFYPIVRQIERAAALAPGDTLQGKLDKLDTVLAQADTSRDDAALIAEMLSLANDGRYPAVVLPAEQRRERTLAALLAQTQALARRHPVLIIYEDAHWSDPTSLEALARLVDRLETLPVLLIVTFRPEFRAPWVGRPYVTSLLINRLTRREAGAMVDAVGGDRLLAGIRDDIIERTDGIPLFVEEMTKAVLEVGSESAAGRAAAAVPSPALAVPASLHASLMARLDRLGPAKDVAQIGAVIGREFSHALLAAVVGKPDAELDAALDRLIATGLLFRQGVPPHASYLFKHALVQDAAYGTLLRERRRALHARVAETVERQFPGIAENEPEQLARHCTEAGLTERAARLWGKAGQRSLARSALVEAKEQLERALAQLAALPATPALRRLEIELQIALIAPLNHVKGHAAPETKAAAERARQLIEQAEALGEPLEDPLLLFSVLYSFWIASFVAFNGDVTRERAEQFLALAERQKAAAPRMIGNRLLGMSFLHSGAFGQGLAHFERALALYDPAAHRPLATRFAVDARVSILAFRSHCLWLLGYPDAARADTERSLAEAREIGQAATLILALLIASVTHLLCGDCATARVEADEGIALAEEKGASYWRSFGTSLRGCVEAATGHAAEAARIVTQGLAASRSTGATLWAPMNLLHLAGAYADLGQFDDARRCSDEAIAVMDATGERWFAAEAQRVAGEILLKSPVPDAATAQAHFTRALEIARGQQAKSWELRAATSMARLMAEQGRAAAARALLAPFYGSFTEGLGTHDLRAARALLDALPS